MTSAKSILIKNIRQLFPVTDAGISFVSGPRMQELNMIENAWLETREGK